MPDQPEQPSSWQAAPPRRAIHPRTLFFAAAAFRFLAPSCYSCYSIQRPENLPPANSPAEAGNFILERMKLLAGWARQGKSLDDFITAAGTRLKQAGPEAAVFWTVWARQGRDWKVVSYLVIAP